MPTKKQYSLMDNPRVCYEAIENASDGIAIVKNLIHQYVNKRFIEIFGYTSKDEIIGKPLGMLLHPEDKERVEEFALMRQRGEDAPTRYDVKCVRKDGEIIYIEASAALIKEGGKNLSIVYVRDITERRKIEDALNHYRSNLEEIIEKRTSELNKINKKLRQEIAEREKADIALRKSENRFREIANLVSDLIWEIDENDICYYVSPETENMLGYKVEEMIGKTPFDFMSPEEADRTREIFDRIKSEKRPFTFIECKFLHKNGNEIDAEVSGLPIFDEKGRYCGYRGVHRDITVRKQIQESLIKKREDLELKSFKLDEINNALNILLKQKEHDRRDFENKVLSNVKELVLPYISALRDTKLDAKQETYVDIIQANVNNIISPFIHKITSKYVNFTPTEIKVATFIKEGKTAKEISKILEVSESAVNLHRQHVRDKLGLSKKKIGLRSYLLSMME